MARGIEGPIMNKVEIRLTVAQVDDIWRQVNSMKKTIYEHPRDFIDDDWKCIE